MVEPDFRTDHLTLDYLDRVWLDGRVGTEPDEEYRYQCLGSIDGDPRWPADLEPEPTWFLTELGELVDRFEDARRFSAGCREAAMDAYERGVGAR